MPYIDSYYSRTVEERTGYPRLAETLDVDVAVVGGGLAGTATALDLAERGVRVALIEARSVGWGASGRNGGFASEGFPGGYKDLAARFGLARAQELHRVARSGLDLVKKRIADYAIACGPNQAGALRCNIVGGRDDLPGFRDFMGRHFDTELEHWPATRLREALSTPRYTDALFIPSTIAVHPLNLNLGLARAACERGARVFENSPVVALETAGGRRKVRTATGAVTADHVVIACGGYVEKLEPKLSGATVPIATFVMATRPLGERLQGAIRVPYAIFDNQFDVNYYRPLADTRMLWGGRVLAWEPSPERIARVLKRDMAEFYPSIADAEVEVAWGGMMPMTRHQMPVIGRVEPGLWYATGFGGLGVTLTSAFGRLIARAIDEDDDSWRVFEAFGLPFAGGKLGRIPAQLIYWSHQLRSKLGIAGAH